MSRSHGDSARSPPRGAVARPHLSYSAISTYQACPLRYFYRYVAELPETTIAAGLVLGGAFHRSLQVHFEDLLAGRPAPALENLIEVFWEEWHSHDHQEILFPRGEDLGGIRRLAERMLRAFQRSPLAQPDGRILAIEEAFRAKVLDGVPELLARVDLVVETVTHLEVIDFKTARSEWTSAHVLDASGQLLLYGELVKGLAPDKPLRLKFGVVTKTKFPQVAIHEVQAGPDDWTRTRCVIDRVWRAIECGHFYPAPTSFQCPTCPYRAPCQGWQG